MLRYYAWNDAGKLVGASGSLRRNSDGRTGMAHWCDKGDLFQLCYSDTAEEAEPTVYPFLSFDSETPNDPPWILGTVSGSFTVLDGATWDYNTSTGYISNLKFTRLKITVKNGYITGWETQ